MKTCSVEFCRDIYPSLRPSGSFCPSWLKPCSPPAPLWLRNVFVPSPRIFDLTSYFCTEWIICGDSFRTESESVDQTLECKVWRLVGYFDLDMFRTRRCVRCGVTYVCTQPRTGPAAFESGPLHTHTRRSRRPRTCCEQDMANTPAAGTTSYTYLVDMLRRIKQKQKV